MAGPAALPSVDRMDVIKKLHWPLILGLGAVAMIRPLVSTVGSAVDVSRPPAVSITLGVLISAVWIAVVGFTRVRHPILTLLFTGLAYAVYSIIFSAIMSPILSGQLQGPLANPIAILPIFITNAIWGAIAGLLALALQRARGFRPEVAPPGPGGGPSTGSGRDRP